MCLCVQCVQCPTCNALVGGWPTVELLFSYVCNVSAGMVTCSVCGCVQVRARAVCVSQTAEHWWGVGALQSSSLATYMCNVRTGMVTCVHARAGVKYVCLCACVHLSSVWNSDCRALVGSGWRAAELLCRERSVSWGPAGTNQAPATLPPPCRVNLLQQPVQDLFKSWS